MSMKKTNLLLIAVFIIQLTLCPIYSQKKTEDIFTPVGRVTEKERLEIKNHVIGMTVYQTDNLSGLYSYTNEGWVSIPANNEVLKSAMVCPQVTVVDTVFDLNTLPDLCADATTAIALGYHKKGDGGGGIFVYNDLLDDPDIDGEGDGGLIFDGWERSLIDRSINVKWFGARGNGSGSIDANLTEAMIISQNTIAFQKAVGLLNNEIILSIDDPNTPSPNSEDSSIPEASYGIFIPSGEYLLGEQALFKEDFGLSLKGITYFSDGNAVLTFKNTGNSYGFHNKNNGMFFTFRNLTFRGVDASTNFIFSDSQGIAQDYYFDRCTFRGQFDRVFTIRGGVSGNTNSEWGFNKCTFTSHNSLILDIKDSNQFLNYWFDQTKFWMTGNSRVLKTDNGGHFKFVNCDWSGFSPNEETFLFELNGDGGNGVSDFIITNGRFEMKTEYAKVLKSNWTNGNIAINADFGSQTFQPFFTNNPNGVEHFDFRIRETSGLNISFKNSVMMGTHTYRYNQSSFKGTARAKYENCAFARRESLDGFINIADNLSNKSGISLISIEDAIFQSVTLNSVTNNNESILISNIPITNVDYLPLRSNRGIKTKSVKIGNASTGNNPIGNEQIILNFPEESESIIHKVKWFLPKDRLSSINNVRFVLTNTLGDVLQDIDGNEIFVEGIMKDGYNKTQEVFINVKNLPEGKVILKAVTPLGVQLPNQVASEFLCIVDYY